MKVYRSKGCIRMDAGYRRRKLAHRFGLGEPLVSTRISGCELSIHTAEHARLRDRLRRPFARSPFWRVTISPFGDDSAHPLPSDREQDYVLHWFGGRYEPGLVVYGVIPTDAATVEITVGEGEPVPVQVEAGVFLAVLPEAPEIVIAWRDRDGTLVRRRRFSTEASEGNSGMMGNLRERWRGARAEYQRRLEERGLSHARRSGREEARRLADETGLTELEGQLMEWGMQLPKSGRVYLAIRPNTVTGLMRRRRPAYSIERLARESVPPCSDPGFVERVRHFKVFAKRETPLGVLAFYTGVCALLLGGGDRFYGYIRVTKDGERSGGSWMREGSSPSGAELVEFRTDSDRSDKSRYASIYGLVSPAVAAVEATFSDGQTDRMEPVDRAFALVAVGADEVRELRLLDSTGTLLHAVPSSTFP